MRDGRDWRDVRGKSEARVRAKIVRAAEDVRPYHVRARIGEAYKIGCEERGRAASRRAE